MFSNSEIDSVGFTSNWKFSRTSEDSSAQTTEIVGDDKDSQSKHTHPVGVQTEDEELLPMAAPYDEDKLAAFLGRVCPQVVKELDRVTRSNAFALYTLTADTEEEMEEVMTLAPCGEEGISVSELSWNCTGSVLAVALSHTLHTSWCSHQGQVALYNVDRESNSPSRTLEASSCIRSVSMHPYLSSIVAAGTFSGEVLVWDTVREGSEAALVNASRTSHNDSVTQVRFVLGADTAVTLVSSALDGHLIFWKVSPKLLWYQVLERYRCDLSSMEPGVTCFAFPYHKQDTFVVGMEGGALLHCSTTAAKLVPSVGNSEAIKDPVISSFESQPATVTYIDFSSHHDDLFATVTTDQAIRIYSLFQRCPQRVVWGAGGLAGVGWSPSQANVLAGWGSSSTVTIYNSVTGDTLTVFSPPDNERKACLTAMAFNAKSPRLLAVGDLEGVAHIWKIPSHLPSKPKNL